MPLRKSRLAMLQLESYSVMILRNILRTAPGWLALAALAVALGRAAAQGLHCWETNRVHLDLERAFLSGNTSDGMGKPMESLVNLEPRLMNLQAAHGACSGGLDRSLARAELALQQPNRVVARLAPLAGQPGADPLALLWLGKAYGDQGNWNEALTTWRAAGASVALEQAGDALVQQRQWTEAATAYLDVIALRPGDCTDPVRAGKALWASQHDLPGAMAQFERAVQLCPGRADGYAAAGEVLIDAQEYDRAEQWLVNGQKKALEAPQLLTKLALLRIRQNRSEEALPLLEQALAANSGNSEAHAYLGLVYWNQGRSENAVAEFEQAIDLGPPQAWQHDAVGMAYEKMGLQAEAIKAYQRALTLDARDRTAWNRLRRLQEEQ